MFFKRMSASSGSHILSSPPHPSIKKDFFILTGGCVESKNIVGSQWHIQFILLYGENLSTLCIHVFMKLCSSKERQDDEKQKPLTLFPFIIK